MTTTRVGVHQYVPPAESRTRFPSATLTRHFIGPGPLDKKTADLADLVKAACDPAWSAGMTPVVSFKLLPAEVLLGTWDARLDELAALFATPGRDAIVIPWHEPANDTTLFTPASYAKAFRHQRDRLRQFANVDVAYCDTSFCWRPGDARTADPKPWRSIIADLYLCDVYQGLSWPAETPLWQHSGFIRWKTEIADQPGPGGMPRGWGLGEWGRSAGPRRPGLWRADVEWLADLQRRPEVVVFWGTGGSERSVLWPFDEPTTAVIRDELIPQLATPAGYAWSETVPGALVQVTTGALYDPAYLPAA